MKVKEFKKILEKVPDNYDIVDYYNLLQLVDVEIDKEDKTILLVMEDD